MRSKAGGFNDLRYNVLVTGERLITKDEFLASKKLGRSTKEIDGILMLVQRTEILIKDLEVEQLRRDIRIRSLAWMGINPYEVDVNRERG